MELHDEIFSSHTFRRDGQYWTIIYDDNVVRLKNTKGMRYIARLLCKPQQSFKVLDLVALEGNQPLDYDVNYSDMSNEQLAEERLRNSDLSDPGMKRGQRGASYPLEKARKAASKNITDALKVIGQGHPSLWQHLKNSIKMGDACTYSPLEHISWDC